MLNNLKKKIVVGTVQFGQSYGVTNFSKKPTLNQIYKILSLAYENNLNKFDTAPGYNTEKILGNFIKVHGLEKKVNIFTKIPTIRGKNIEDHVRISIEKSMKNINSNIDTLFFHDASDSFKLMNKAEFIKKIKKDYMIKNIGFSIYNKKEIKSVNKIKFKFSFQYPLSIANNEFEKINFGKGKNFARSIFLQGLLLNEQSKKEIPKSLKESVNLFHNSLKMINQESLELCMSYVANNRNVDYFLIGIDNINQLNKILLSKPVKKKKIKLIKNLNLLFKKKDIDPRKW
jgi:aryl-alcohol dehydrogenase-like predicted oxidoreductase